MTAAAPPPLRLGVLGTGRIAGKLAAAMTRTPAVEAVAVGSREVGRARSFATVYDIPAAHGEYGGALDDPHVDAVYIALPPHRHAEWAIAAARRGKPVLCEKPLAPTADEAAEMAEACDRAGVALVDGTQWTRTARADRLRALLNSGAVGELKRVTSAFSFQAAGWGATEHRLDPHRGGGCLADLGWYCAHAALWATGETPESVAAHLTTEPAGADGGRVDTAASVSLRFPGRGDGRGSTWGTARRGGTGSSSRGPPAAWCATTSPPPATPRSAGSSCTTPAATRPAKNCRRAISRPSFSPAPPGCCAPATRTG